MTEGEWMACEAPGTTLDFLRRKTSERKLRLFAVACFQRVSHLLPDNRQRRAIEVLEEMAEGKATTEARRVAASGARQSLPWNEARYDAIAADDPYFVALMLYREFVSSSTALHAATVTGGVANGTAEQQAQNRLLRCIVGNPFHPVTFDSSWLAWNNGTVVNLAQAIYDERAFDRMPILADALEDAGCHQQDILAHCRGGGEHVRGCWVVDLVLGKK